MKQLQKFHFSPWSMALARKPQAKQPTRPMESKAAKKEIQRHIALFQHITGNMNTCPLYYSSERNDIESDRVPSLTDLPYIALAIVKWQSKTNS